MVMTSGYTYVQLVHGDFCLELPAESAETQLTYVIHHTNDMYSGGFEPEISQRSWIQMILHRNGILAANENSMHII
jgi:hypothetical protein